MGTEAFTVRTDSKKVKQPDKQAKQQDRSRNYRVNQASEQMLEMQAWQVERIEEGIKAADENRSSGDAEKWHAFSTNTNSSFGVQNQEDCDDNRLNAQDICREVQRKVE